MLAVGAFSSCTASIGAAAIAIHGPHVNAQQFTYNCKQRKQLRKHEHFTCNAAAMRVGNDEPQIAHNGVSAHHREFSSPRTSTLTAS